MAVWVDVAPKDVDEALADAEHAGVRVDLGPRRRKRLVLETGAFATPCYLGCADSAISEFDWCGRNCSLSGWEAGTPFEPG
jgi:hypothetical protein